MMRIQAIMLNNRPIAQPLTADFNEMGGSIGRAEGNALVLPDEKRYISRTQATITFQTGNYHLRDHGSATPTLINGTAVGNGHDVMLREGDQIRIGDYILSVSLQAPPTSPLGTSSAALNDPFADLLPINNPASSLPSRPIPNSQPAAPALNHQRDPFADPLFMPVGRPSSAAQPHIIPPDFDPFAQASSLPNNSEASLPDDLGIIPSGSQSVDDIFGLKSESKASWDPLAREDSLSARSSLLDPFSDEQASGPSSRAAPIRTQRDDASMLSSAFSPPQPRYEEPSAPAPGSAMPLYAEPGPRSTDMVVSWDGSSSAKADGKIKTVILPSPRREPSNSHPDPVHQGATHQTPPATHASTAPAAEAAVPATAMQPGNDELLRAFLAGADVQNMNLPSGLTPDLMNLFGQLMYESIRGTLDLLLARALTKREVRAQTTVIVARENNPLKFSPTVEAALTNLLTAQVKGFMPPVDAMRDAYNDLRSHQFGIMAGMRAALEGVLARFDPAQLEQRLKPKGVLGSLLSSNRKAELWELYEQLYREISKEAEDDFQTLFGKEFLRAYDAQIKKLEQEDAAR